MNILKTIKSFFFSLSGRIKRGAVLPLALPSIISNITVPLLGMIDVAITGHMGAETFIGAIAVGGMLFNVIYWLFGFLRMGTSGMTAQARGAQCYDDVRMLLRRSLTVAWIIALIIIVLQWPIREFALWMIAPSDDVATLTRTYFNICIWGAIPSLSLFALMGWFIGMQNTRIPMIISILQNVLNIVLSLLFVYVFGMQIEGVAWGTVLAQWAGFFVALSLVSGERRVERGKRRVESGESNEESGESNEERVMSKDFSWARFFSVNRDIFLRTCCLVAVHFYFISAGARYGTTCLAVNTLLMQLFTLYSYFLDGFAFAGEALTGKAIGAGNRQQLSTTVRELFAWGVAMSVLFCVVYAGWGRGVLSLFTDSQEVLTAANDYWTWTLLFPVCGMAAFIWDGIFCGATASRGMLVSVFVSMATFFILERLLSPFLGNHALWLAFVIYLSLRGIMQTILWKKKYKTTCI